MFSNEVIPMAVKKSTAPKSGEARTAKAKPAAKKATPKKAAPKQADAKAKAPKGAKKAAPKKAPMVKITEPQLNLLKQVAEAKEGGFQETKGTAKMLGALLGKKLIKRGKKQGEFFLYHITKLGEKHAPAAAPSPEPSSPPLA
jgi:hypothetical protein